METKKYRFDEVTINFDKKRIPLSSAQREKRHGTFRYYGAQGVIDHVDDYIFDGTYLLIAEDGENLKSKKQNIAQVVDGQFWANNHAHIVQGNEQCDTRFLCYLINSMDLSGYVTGSAQPKLSQANLNAVTLSLPTLAEQKRIVEYLYMLDQKIDVNRQINDNLQQQLTAIYKSWYQDFSLVNDTELVETAYGTIPKGWHYVLLGDLCQSISVTHKFDKNALIFLNTGDVEDGRFLHSNLMAVKEMPGQAKKTIAPGDILYSEIRPINRHFAYVNFPSDDYVVSTKLMVIRTKNFDTRRLYHYLTSENVLNELQLQAESRSGTFPQIRFENVSKLPILIADEQTESEFVKILHTVFDQIEQLNRENKQLSELRDTLLPKLMSGEIYVSDIQL